MTPRHSSLITHHSSRPSRRSLLKSSALAGLGFWLAPRSAPAATRSPNEKLNLAGIGIGGQGAWDLEQLASENIVALCDVDDDYAAKTFNKYPKATKYKDFRQLLDQEKSLDAVVVATPDHSHALISATAIVAGKHVYCEKPLTHTVYEARVLTQLAAKHKVATQMGNQGMAFEGNRLIKEWLADGAIGAVREVHAWSDRPLHKGKLPVYWDQGVETPTDQPPTPATLDWDLWLGPARQRPFHPAYLPFKWRGWWDYGSGGLGDMGIHNLAPAFAALDLPAPTAVDASSTALYKDSVPLACVVHYDFPAQRLRAVAAGLRTGRFDAPNLHEPEAQARDRNQRAPHEPEAPARDYGQRAPREPEAPARDRNHQPSIQLHWYDGGILPPRPEELPPGQELDREDGLLFIGDKGKLLVEGWGGEKPRLLPVELDKDYKRPPKTLPRSIGHHNEWIKACKAGTPTASSFAFSGPLTEAVQLGMVCVRNGGQRLEWDSANLKVTNVPKANRFVHYEYRKGWELPT